jgi:hypothetical protein
MTFQRIPGHVDMCSYKVVDAVGRDATVEGIFSACLVILQSFDVSRPNGNRTGTMHRETNCKMLIK